MDNSRRGNGNKRHSGVFDFDQSLPSLVRRTSKRAQSSDRHGHVYAEDFPQGTIRAVTQDQGVEAISQHTSPKNVSSTTATPRPSATGHVRSSSRDRSKTGDLALGSDHSKAASDHASRPRTRTMETVGRNRSPASSAAKGRNRLGSVNALSTASGTDSGESSSIGFPSIISFDQTPHQHRQRLVKSPPRSISPPADMPTATSPLSSSGPSADAARVLQLSKTICGRMHGIMSFRTSRSSAWRSGYCAVNVASGSLIYQIKGDITHARTLIPDLRGCKVRTLKDQETQSNFLEISTNSTDTDTCVHLRPHVPETFDSWLAALLCWQPLKAKEAQPRTPVGQASYLKSKRTNDRRRNFSINLIRDAAIIKVGKMFCWDHDANAISPNASRRISTYKQLRSAAGTPWRRISCTLQENGLLKLFLENDTRLLHIIPLSSLTRSAIQRLHPTVLDDEYCIGIFPQYCVASAEPLDIKQPVYLSLESRVLFEVWYVLLRAFAVPDLYGPEQPSLRASVDLSIAEKQQILDFDDLFRVEKLLSLRIIEAKLHPFDAPTSSPKKNPSQSTGGHDNDWTNDEYHAEVLIDGEIRGKTATKSSTRNPFWREDYEFSDLPPTPSGLFIVLKSKGYGQRDWTSVSDDRYDSSKGDVDNLGFVGDVRVQSLDNLHGTVSLPLDELERNRDHEEWWPILNQFNEVIGEMLMKVRIDEVVVLMSKHYEPVSDLLHSFSNGLTQQITSAYPGEGRRIHEILLNIFQYSSRAGDWITSLVEDEIDGLHKRLPAPRYRYSRRIASNDSYDSNVDREVLLRDMGKNATQEANLLFRGNSLLTKSLDYHMRRLGKEYLEDTLGERIRDINESDPDCEVDPNKVRNKEDLQRNWRNLIALTESVWLSIKASPNRCPPELRAIFRHIRACAEDRYGSFLRTVNYSSVSGFLFLRFFCPAVLNPKLFGLLKDHPRPKAVRTLTLIAKSLQCLANLSTFGNKEPWMEPMNQFINSHRTEFKNYIDTICAVPSDQTSSRVPPSYTAPITIFSRLPQTSKEGFPCLPYLIDQTRELATLANLWIELSSGKSEASDSEELMAFTHICLALRKQTRNTVDRAQRADRPVSDLQQLNWAEMVEKFDRQSSISGYAEYDFASEVTSTVAPGPTNTTGPMNSLTRAARRFKPAPISTGSSSISLSSHQASSTAPSPHRSPLPLQFGNLTGRSSPIMPSPPPIGSGSASGVWDPGTDDRFPTHPLAWDETGGEEGRIGGSVPQFPDNKDSPARSSDIRGPRTSSKKHVVSSKPSSRSLEVENGSLHEGDPLPNEGEKSPVSPREGGRKLYDVWGFSRKKDKEKHGHGGSSDAGKSDADGRKGTLTKRNKEYERERDREKERGNIKRK